MKSQFIRHARRSAAAFSLLFPVFLTGCGGGEPRVDTKKFSANWDSAASEHFTILTPPNSPRKLPALQAFSEVCEDVLSQTRRVIELKDPGRLSIYLFTTNQDCEAATGHSASFVEGNNIFTRLGAPIGGVIAEAACNSIDPGARSFPLVRNGLRVLFDQRDRNIHTDAVRLRAAGRLPTMTDLLGGGAIQDGEAYDYASGSLVAFLLARYGPDQFKMLWKSVLDLKPSLERIYGGTMPQMEEEWTKFLDREAKRA
ncbi:MAG: hypothetical protein AB1792_09435 [Candidatus Zixiibacteriota bacterium]